MNLLICLFSLKTFYVLCDAKPLRSFKFIISRGCSISWLKFSLSSASQLSNSFTNASKSHSNLHHNYFECRSNCCNILELCIALLLHHKFMMSEFIIRSAFRVVTLLIPTKASYGRLLVLITSLDSWSVGWSWSWSFKYLVSKAVAIDMRKVVEKGQGLVIWILWLIAHLELRFVASVLGYCPP